LAAHYSIPSVYSGREFVEVGGLISYGSDIAEAYRQVGIYCGRILKGTKPAELPIVQSTKLDLAINAQTARMLKLPVSLSYLPAPTRRSNEAARVLTILGAAVAYRSQRAYGEAILQRQSATSV